MGEEVVLAVGEIEICARTDGSESDPVMLLISGLAASMDWWEDDFCNELVSAGRYVIRYDHRDTGRSTSYPNGQPGYTGRDLTEDAIGVLDALGVQSARLIGVSAGGGIAQELALLFPDRVDTITLISTTAEGSTGTSLPGPVEPVVSYFADPPPEPDWSDRSAVIEYLVDVERTFASPSYFDPVQTRLIADRVFDRTINIAAATNNHWLAESGEPVDRPLSQITTPTLVLHGTADPLFPYPHGEALAEIIPDARLVPLSGMGHQVPPRELWPIALPEIIAH